MNPDRRDFLRTLIRSASGAGLVASSRLFDPSRLLAGDASSGSPVPAPTGTGSASPDPIGETSGRSAREPSPTDASVKEAYFYEPLESQRIHCLTCPHECVLQPGETGFCRAKRNLGGKHYSLSYGNPCAANIDPIEKKPLFHFHPGSQAFSLAVAGCNFRCLNCQNWEISQISPLESRNYDLPPDRVVELARHYGCPTIAFTYSEPTSFYEYGVDTSALAHREGLTCVWVSNGYIRKAPLDRLSRSISAASINLKSFEDHIYLDLNGGHLQPVMDTLVRLKENGVWLEVINLVIPTYTDNLEMIRRMCDWFLKALGPDTPLHFSRFNPLYKLVHLPPTPVEALTSARRIAMDEGLHYVYIGNVPGTGEDTHCPGCKKVVLARRGFRIVSTDIREGACRFCGENIAGIWS